ncbi:sorting nexin-17-like [Watersipora subatra]|uniref:sorting nexin-17-like n=1 Tax=Watersipora subatra TaxID=2589382 RepID=UPI00355B863F
MHFSIPDTQEFQDPNNSSKFTAFNIHVNGVFHCAVRFKQLHNFHEQLSKEFGNDDKIPPFPPKKLFSLNAQELEDRRLHLEKYIQMISQDHKIQNHQIFTGFFLNAQHETQSAPGEEVSLDVFLMNGHKITVKITSTDQTDLVHEAVCSSISLNDDFVYYFGLYLIKKESTGDNSIVRKLQDFESPYLSLKAANQSGVHRLVLRKSFWDTSMDEDLIEDRVAMNLLYVQATSDIDRGWVVADKEQHKRLAALQQKNSKKEYLRLARTLKFYGHLQFQPCVSDYPAVDTSIRVHAGHKQLTFHILDGPNKSKEGIFLVTRMRCWRITSLPLDSTAGAGSSSSGRRMELAIEYLLSKDNLKWITLQTNQAILISMCLQAMVDELMMKKSGRRMRRPQDREKSGLGATFMKRDGTVLGEPEQEDSVAKRISDKLSSLNLMGKAPPAHSSSHNGESSSNSAFGGIGDDDL